MTQLLERIPIAWRAILGVVVIFGSGWSASVLLAETASLRPRVEVIERRQDHVEAGVSYLICRAQAQDRDQDPRTCQYLLRRIEDQLESIRQGRQ